MTTRAEARLSVSTFASLLIESGIERIYGVPDSTLDPLVEALASSRRVDHRTCSNEAHALAHAAGSFLASGKPALVYLQNSGLGNVVNPYTSLLAPEAMGLPALLLMGWRSPPGVSDEPQHHLMGKVTLPLLRTLGIGYAILEDDAEIGPALRRAQEAFAARTCFALIVPKGTSFLRSTSTECAPGSANGQASRPAEMAGSERPDRWSVLKLLTAHLRDALFVSTTGKTSRELYLLRTEQGCDPDADLRIVGSMGCAASVANGISDAKPGRRICVVDGDGALLMHLGSLASTAAPTGRPFLHVVLDNGTHDSTGGQPIASPGAPFEDFARGFGYVRAVRARGLEALRHELEAPDLWQGPRMLVVPIAKGSLPDLGRPGTSPQRNAETVANALRVAP